MKSLHWLTLSTLVCVGLMAPATRAQVVTTPLSSPIQISGESGGTTASNCGNIPNQPQQQVSVTESFTALRLQVTAAPSSTLLVRGSDGTNLCVMADAVSGGTMTLPALWNPGQYSIYVGDRGTERHAFTLSIIPE